jgi:molecular chaperone GrpE
MPHKKKQPIEEPGEEKIEAEEPAPITEEMTEESDWQAKSEEYLNDLKRCQADFENYKKRQQESQKELKGLFIEKLVLDIIPVLDNFRAATMHVPDEQKDSPWVIGIQYIEKQLETVLTDNGMQTIEAAEGDVFDPTIHEAIDSQQSTDNSQQEEETEEKAHTIAKVVQKGYRLGDKVIRAARVIVK